MRQVRYEAEQRSVRMSRERDHVMEREYEGTSRKSEEESEESSTIVGSWIRMNTHRMRSV